MLHASPPQPQAARPTGGSKQIPLVLNREAASERRVVDFGLHGPCWQWHGDVDLHEYLMAI
jgi:hypothetical protein